MMFSTFFLLFVRSAGCTFLFPGRYSEFSITARLGCAFVFTLSFSTANPITTSPIECPYTLMLILELLIGGLIALPFHLSVKSFLMAASLLEQGRGQNLGAVYGGSVEQEGDGQLGKVFEYGTISLLLFAGLLPQIFFLLAKSYMVAPVGSLTFQRFGSELGGVILSTCFDALSFSFILFLPFGALFLLCDLSLGFLSKLIPGLPIFAEMFVLKSALTFLMLIGVLLPSWEFFTDRSSNSAESTARALLHLLGG